MTKRGSPQTQAGAPAHLSSFVARLGGLLHSSPRLEPPGPAPQIRLYRPWLHSTMEGEALPRGRRKGPSRDSLSTFSHSRSSTAYPLSTCRAPRRRLPFLRGRAPRRPLTTDCAPAQIDAAEEEVIALRRRLAAYAVVAGVRPPTLPTSTENAIGIGIVDGAELEEEEEAGLEVRVRLAEGCQ